jgi:hypothetical protein
MNQMSLVRTAGAAEIRAPRARGDLRDLWRGFVSPSGFAFTLILATALLSAAALCAVVTPSLLAGPLGVYLPRSTKDSEAAATHKALALAIDAPTPGVPRLCMVSNSVLAHSFADEAGTAKDLKAATGQGWQVTFLTTPLQGPIDQAVLADYATRQSPCLVVMGMNFMRYSMTKEQVERLDTLVRLGVTSPWGNVERAEIGLSNGRHLGIYALDNSRFLLRRAPTFAARMLLRRPAVPPIADYAPDKPLGDGELAKRRDIITAGLFQTNNDLPDRTLRRLMELLKARHSPVLFVEEPVSPDLFRTAAEKAAYQSYLARSERTAKDMGGSYCRLQAAFQPPASQYADYLHLINPGSQERLRQGLASCVASTHYGQRVNP